MPAFLPRVHLINAKLKPPQLASALIERGDLLAAIDQAVQKKLLLLVAQIGSGKTTLLSQWHERAHRGRSIAWLSLDEHDNDPRSFFSYLTAAVRNSVQGFEAYVTGALRDDAEPPLDHINAVFIESLARIGHELVIVLDDFQWVSNASLLQAFRYLLQRSPPHIHWVLSSRCALDLPLSQLKLQDQLAQLGTAELNLASSDVADLSFKLHGRALARADADYIRGRTEGWVAGTKLALLSVSDRPDTGEALRRFTGSHQEVARYLAGAVLNDQPAEVRKFLLVSAIVDKMNGELCNALLGISNGEQLLDRLEQSQLFVQSLDHHRHWYRYHLLFLDFLRSHLVRDYADRIPQWHKVASQWFAEHEMNEEALTHAFAAGDRGWCVEMTARCALGWMKSGQTQEILCWAAKLTQAELLSHSDLCCAYVMSLILSRRFADATAMLQLAKGQAARVQHLRHSAQHGTALHRLKLLDLVLHADIPDDPGFTDYDLSIDGDTDGFFVGILMTTQTSRLMRMNQFNAARRLAMRAREVGKQANNLYVASYAEMLTSTIDFMQGNLRAAGETCERNFAALQGAQKSPAWVNAAVALACARYEQNRLAEAHALFLDVLPLVSAASTVRNFLTAYIVLARLKALQQKREEALQLLDYAHSVLETDSHPRFLAQLCFEKVRLHLEGGQLARAQAVASEFGLPQLAARHAWAAGRDYEESWVRYGFAQALLWMHEQRYGECHAVLSVLCDGARRAGRIYRQMALEMALAMCHWRAGDDEAAFEVLNRCLVPTQQIGFARAAFDETPGLPGLFRAAVAAGRLDYMPPTRYFKQYVGNAHRKHLLPSLQASRPPSPPREPLTHREVLILRLVAQGFCNKAISESSHICLNTTKWHLRNAFMKLDVKSRTGAVARARELRLID